MSRSVPPANASSAPTTSSLLRPRSRAKWFLVPAGTTTCGIPCAAATVATRACDPSPPAMPMTPAPSEIAFSASCTRSSPGFSTIGSMSRARHSSARRNRVALPPPDLGLMTRTGRSGFQSDAFGSARATARLVRPSATRAQPTDAAASRHASMTNGHRRSAPMRLNITRITAAATMISASQRIRPRRETTYHPATTATSSPASPRITHSQFMTAPATSSAMAAMRVTSDSHAASRRTIVIRASVCPRAPPARLTPGG
jgi:hypothetical protein